MNRERIPCVVFYCACIYNKKRTPRCVVDTTNFTTYWYNKIEQPSNEFAVFDIQRRSFFGGKMPQLLDFATKSIVMLRLEGDMFTGFDFKTRSVFRTFVVDEMVRFYDFQNNKTYAYSLRY